jgi:putative transposase
MINYFLPFEEGEFYHIYNRGNNKGLIFYNANNYSYFLNKLSFYLSDYLDFYSYCLLPNHFHLLIQVKNFNSINKEKQLLTSGTKILTEPHDIISEQFRRFFLSYSKSIIIQEKRTGSLFQKNFKRIKIHSPKYYTFLINYIHRNPISHKISKDYKTYAYSSYNSILSNLPTRLKRKEVLDWFGNMEEFIRYHDGNSIYKEAEKFIIE